MAALTNVAPVIIKRKKVVVGGGHHGGAWKVAYADFVTAMMSFFLLMWLLNATTQKQRKGIADYFNPTIPISRVSGGGQGMFGGNSIFSEQTLARNGTGARSRKSRASRHRRGQARADSAAKQTNKLKGIETRLLGRGGDSMVARLALKHVATRLTDEGLIVEIFDLPGLPLFKVGTTTPTATMKDLARMLAELFRLVTNGVAIEGHIRALPIVLAHDPSWDLSTSRAQAVRGLLQGDGLPAARVQRVTGWGNRRPVTENPMAVRNNRVEVILLRSDIGSNGANSNR